MIKKTLDLPGVSAARQQRHLANIQREVAVLKRLRGTLSVVQLEAVYEDNDAVYIVMEKCSGGELWRPRGQRDYSEQMVWGGLHAYVLAQPRVSRAPRRVHVSSMVLVR